LKPCFTPNGLKYGDLSLEEFERRFITSIASTAIEVRTMGAEKGTLHEIEIISNRDMSTREPVYLCGYVFVKEESQKGFNIKLEMDKQDIKDIKMNDKSIIDVLKQGIQVGGERKYGYGLVELVYTEKEDDSKFSTEGDSIFVELEKKSFIEAHLKTDRDLLLRGELEAISAKEWGDKGAGRRQSVNAFIAWAPGSLCEDKIRAKIGPFGVWECFKENRGKFA